MAIITTAMTAPVMWLIWLRGNRQGTEGLESDISENYLTSGLDVDFNNAQKDGANDDIVGQLTFLTPDAVQARDDADIQPKYAVAVSTI